MLRPRLSRPRPVRATTQRPVVRPQVLTPKEIASNYKSNTNKYSRNTFLPQQQLFTICYEPFSVWSKLLKADVTCPKLSTSQARKGKGISKLKKISKNNSILIDCMPLPKTEETTKLLSRGLLSNNRAWPLYLHQENMLHSHHRLVGPWCHRAHFHEYTSNFFIADAPLHSSTSSISVSALPQRKNVERKRKNRKEQKCMNILTKQQWSQLTLWKRMCRLYCKFCDNKYMMIPKLETHHQEEEELEELEEERGNVLINLNKMLEKIDKNKIVSNLKDVGELTDEKKIVLQMAMQGASMFIGGKAGTGKSHLLREIVREMSACGLRVAVTASTGVAALNINGNTFHSTFGVPIEFDSNTECKFQKHNNVIGTQAITEREPKNMKESKKSASKAKKCENEESEESTSRKLSKKEILIENNEKRCSSTSERSHNRVWFASSLLSCVDVIVIDEISMLHAGYFEALEVAARCARPHSKHIPFGGVQVIVSGDFMQLRPFADNVGQSQTTTATSTIISKNSRTYNQEQGKQANGKQKEKCKPDNGNQEIDERIVCKGVERNRDVIKKVASEKCTLTYVDNISNNNSCTNNCTDRKKKKNLKNKAKNVNTTTNECSSVVSVRESIAYYCNHPMYDSYAFRHYLVHLQLHVAARQVDDLDFLDDLNALRRGVLSHRLLYSASLNKPDATAIRLYATKRAVRDFNALQMLELKGKEHVFTTKLHLGFSSPISTDSKCDNNRKENGNNNCITGGDNASSKSSNKELSSSSYKMQSDAVLLEFYKAVDRENNNKNNHNNAGSKSQRFRSWKTLIQNIAQSAGIGNHELSMHEIAGNVYMRSKMCRVILRCNANSAQHALARLRLFEASAARLIKTHSPSSSSRVQSGWNLVRYREINQHQLSALARPAIERRIRRHMMLDFVLQNKNLKVGCRVMLLRNLNNKYVNGSLGTVVSFRSIHKCRHLIPTDLKANLHPLCFHVRNNNNSTVAMEGNSQDDRLHEDEDEDEDEKEESDKLILPIVRMDHDRTLVAIPWIELELPAAVEEAMVSGKVWAMPLIPAYAFTVHKIQGITFDHPILFDAEGMFVADHIVYVAASRVKRFDQLRICNLSPRMITVHKPSMMFSDNLPDVYSAANQ